MIPEEAAPRDHGLHLTGAGFAVLGGSVVLGVAGWLFAMPELVAPAVAGVVALTVALAWVALPLGLDVTRRFRPERVTVDAPAASLLGFTNTGRIPVPGLQAVDRVGGRPLRVAVPGVAGGGTASVRTLLPTDRRGRLELGPVRAERVDPLGLVNRWRAVGAEGILWVWPRVHHAEPLATGVVIDLEGPVTDTATEGTLTFSGLREYVAGDDLRRIHWPTTARTGTMMVRTHVDTSQPRATLVLDTRPAGWDESRFEQGIEVVASTSEAFRRVGHAVDLRIPGERRSESSRLGARTELDRLALAATGSADKKLDLFGELERSDGGGALVLVTGDASPRLLATLAQQRRRFAPVVLIRILDGAHVRSHRTSGVLELMAPTAVLAVATWNREVRR